VTASARAPGIVPAIRPISEVIFEDNPFSGCGRLSIIERRVGIDQPIDQRDQTDDGGDPNSES
jgi:hypothetical protein